MDIQVGQRWKHWRNHVTYEIVAIAKFKYHDQWFSDLLIVYSDGKDTYSRVEDEFRESFTQIH